MPQSTFPTPPATTTAARPQVIVDVEDEDVDRSVGVNGAEAIEPRGRSEGMITMTKTATTTPCRRKSANSKPPYLTVLPRLSVRRQKERREKTSCTTKFGTMNFAVYHQGDTVAGQEKAKEVLQEAVVSHEQDFSEAKMRATSIRDAQSMSLTIQIKEANEMLSEEKRHTGGGKSTKVMLLKKKERQHCRRRHYLAKTRLL
eukprot:scaffold2693_cov178-Ochromonas_danica.AAC.2